MRVTKLKKNTIYYLPKDSVTTNCHLTQFRVCLTRYYILSWRSKTYAQCVSRLAFDCVDQNSLVGKLNHYGIRGMPMLYPSWGAWALYYVGIEPNSWAFKTLDRRRAGWRLAWHKDPYLTRFSSWSPSTLMTHRFNKGDLSIMPMTRLSVSM